MLFVSSSCDQKQYFDYYDKKQWIMNELQGQVKKLRLRTHADDLKSVDCGNNRTEKLFHFNTAQTQQTSQSGLFLFR